MSILNRAKQIKEYNDETKIAHNLVDDRRRRCDAVIFATNFLGELVTEDDIFMVRRLESWRPKEGRYDTWEFFRDGILFRIRSVYKWEDEKYFWKMKVRLKDYTYLWFFGETKEESEHWETLETLGDLIEFKDRLYEVPDALRKQFAQQGIS